MATTRDITYEADGRTMIGTLALPDGADTTSVPASWSATRVPGSTTTRGLGRCGIADELGYVAFALDYHGDGKPITDRDQMMARIGELRSDPARAFAVGTAGLDILRAEPRTDPERLAAIGFCFGGTLSLELARGGADLKAVVGFHSGLSTVHPEDARNITGKVLALIGADDPMVHADERRAFEEEMRAGGVDWELNRLRRRRALLHEHAGLAGHLPRHRLRRGDGPPVLAGDGRPVQRGLRLNG